MGNNRADARAPKGAGAIGSVLKAGIPALLALGLAACGGGGGGGSGGGSATPANQVGTVTISGTAAQNQSLTANVSDGNGVPTTVAYQWMANGTAIAGATAKTYGLTQADVGKTITVKATYTDNNGYAEAPVSAATAAVADVNDAPVLSFAPSGATVMNAGTNTTFVGVRVAADGKIVAAGTLQRTATNNDFLIARYNADGSPDTTFGTNGISTLDFAGNNDFITTRPVILADGRILVAGYSLSATTGYDFAVARFNTDGSPDMSFGANGRATIDFNQGRDTAYSMAVANDGKILLAGTVQSPATQKLEVAFSRLMPDGSLDASFGVAGRSTGNFGLTATNHVVDDVAIQSTGQIYAIAISSNAEVLMRLTANGVIDTTFGTSGRLLLPFLSAKRIVATPTDTLMVAGTDYGTYGANMAVSRYLANGQLDTTFGSNGKAVIDFAGMDDSAYDLRVRGDGKILVAGVADTPPVAGRGNAAVALLNSNGQVDTTFGGNAWYGKVQYDVSGYWDTAYAMDLQADGKIVLAGAATDQGRGVAPDAFLVRLMGNGSVDYGFGIPNGIFYENGSPSFIAAGHAYDPDVPANGNYNGYRLMLKRAGTADPGDVFSMGNAVTLSGGVLADHGTTVGSATQSGGVLTIQFNDKATQGVLDDVITAIAIRNTSQQESGRTTIEWTFTDPLGLSAVMQTNFYFTDDFGNAVDAQIDFLGGKPSLVNRWQSSHVAYTSRSTTILSYTNYLLGPGSRVPLFDGNNSATWTSVTYSSIPLHMATLTEMQALYQTPGRPAAYSAGEFWTATGDTSYHAVIDMGTGAVRYVAHSANESHPAVFFVP